MRSRLLVTGFGPFGEVTFNPSGAIAEALHAAPPGAWQVSSALLPVTFAGAPQAIDAALHGLDRAPDLLLGLGVHPGRAFRIERCARGVFVRDDRPDTSGVTARTEPSLDRDRLESTVDVLAHARDLCEAGAGAVIVSSDAGQYVCERAYHRLLARARSRGIAAIFIHVPPADALTHATQTSILRRYLDLVARRVTWNAPRN